MRHLLTAVALLAAAVPLWADDNPKAASPVGLWLGTLKVSVIELRLVFRIDPDKDDKEKLTAKMFSIDQTDQPIPVKAVTFADGKLTLDLPDHGIKFEGKMNEKGDTVSGTLEQGAPFPLKLERIEKMPTLNRPQTPKAPFPYPSEEVTFENTAAKDLSVKDDPPTVKLAGTVTLPKGDGPFPAVVLVSGSGPQDRDETLFGHKPFLVLADHFARNGIACLRYDDRGTHKSKGRFAGATSADFATDAYAAVQYLKAHKKVDPKRVGVAGHSEGGVIAPLVAAAHPDDVGFIILLAGPGVSGERILYQQALDFGKLADATTTEAEVKEFVDAVMPVLKSDTKADEVTKELTEVMKKLVAKEKDEKKRAEAEKGVGAGVARLADPWMRWFIAHDPAPTLEKVKCPVLAVIGEKDAQVRAKDNLEAIESALKRGGNKQFKCVEFKGLNHLFQTCKTGMLSEYGVIEETIAPEVLKGLTEWISERK